MNEETVFSSSQSYQKKESEVKIIEVHSPLSLKEDEVISQDSCDEESNNFCGQIPATSMCCPAISGIKEIFKESSFELCKISKKNSPLLQKNKVKTSFNLFSKIYRKQNKLYKKLALEERLSNREIVNQIFSVTSDQKKLSVISKCFMIRHHSPLGSKHSKSVRKTSKLKKKKPEFKRLSIKLVDLLTLSKKDFDQCLQKHGIKGAHLGNVALEHSLNPSEDYSKGKPILQPFESSDGEIPPYSLTSVKDQAHPSFKCSVVQELIEVEIDKPLNSIQSCDPNKDSLGLSFIPATTKTQEVIHENGLEKILPLQINESTNPLINSESSSSSNVASNFCNFNSNFEPYGTVNSRVVQSLQECSRERLVDHSAPHENFVINSFDIDQNQCCQSAVSHANNVSNSAHDYIEDSVDSSVHCAAGEKLDDLSDEKMRFFTSTDESAADILKLNSSFINEICLLCGNEETVDVNGPLFSEGRSEICTEMQQQFKQASFDTSTTIPMDGDLFPEENAASTEAHLDSTSNQILTASSASTPHDSEFSNSQREWDIHQQSLLDSKIATDAPSHPLSVVAKYTSELCSTKDLTPNFSYENFHSEFQFAENSKEMDQGSERVSSHQSFHNEVSTFGCTQEQSIAYTPNDDLIIKNDIYERTNSLESTKNSSIRNIINCSFKEKETVSNINLETSSSIINFNGNNYFEQVEFNQVDGTVPACQSIDKCLNSNTKEIILNKKTTINRKANARTRFNLFAKVYKRQNKLYQKIALNEGISNRDMIDEINHITSKRKRFPQICLSFMKQHLFKGNFGCINKKTSSKKVFLNKFKLKNMSVNLIDIFLLSESKFASILKENGIWVSFANTVSRKRPGSYAAHPSKKSKNTETSHMNECSIEKPKGSLAAETFNSITNDTKFASLLDKPKLTEDLLYDHKLHDEIYFADFLSSSTPIRESGKSSPSIQLNSPKLTKKHLSNVPKDTSQNDLNQGILPLEIKKISLPTCTWDNSPDRRKLTPQLSDPIYESETALHGTELTDGERSKLQLDHGLKKHPSNLVKSKVKIKVQIKQPLKLVNINQRVKVYKLRRQGASRKNGRKSKNNSLKSSPLTENKNIETVSIQEDHPHNSIVESNEAIPNTVQTTECSSCTEIFKCSSAKEQLILASKPCEHCKPVTDPSLSSNNLIAHDSNVLDKIGNNASEKECRTLCALSLEGKEKDSGEPPTDITAVVNLEGSINRDVSNYSEAEILNLTCSSVDKLDLSFEGECESQPVNGSHPIIEVHSHVPNLNVKEGIASSSNSLGIVSPDRQNKTENGSYSVTESNDKPFQLPEDESNMQFIDMEQKVLGPMMDSTPLIPECSAQLDSPTDHLSTLALDDKIRSKFQDLLNGRLSTEISLLAKGLNNESQRKEVVQCFLDNSKGVVVNNFLLNEYFNIKQMEEKRDLREHLEMQKEYKALKDNSAEYFSREEQIAFIHYYSHDLHLKGAPRSSRLKVLLKKGGYIIIPDNKVSHFLEDPNYFHALTSDVIRFGTCCPNDNSLDKVRKLLHRECKLLLLHQSCLFDWEFVSLLRALYFENTPKKKKSLVVIRRNTLIYCHEQLFSMMQSSKESKTLNILKRNLKIVKSFLHSDSLQQVDFIQLIDDDEFENSDTSNLKRLVKGLERVHRSYNWSHKEAAVVVGQALKGSCNKTKFYKVILPEDVLQKIK